MDILLAILMIVNMTAVLSNIFKPCEIEEDNLYVKKYLKKRKKKENKEIVEDK